MSDTTQNLYGAGQSDAANGKGGANTNGMTTAEREAYNAGFNSGKK